MTARSGSLTSTSDETGSVAELVAAETWPCCPRVMRTASRTHFALVVSHFTGTAGGVLVKRHEELLRRGDDSGLHLMITGLEGTIDCILARIWRHLDVLLGKEEYGDIVRNARRKLRRPTSPAMPCRTPQLATLCTECGRRPARLNNKTKIVVGGRR